MTLKSTTMLTKPLKRSAIAWKPHGYQKKAIKFLLQNSCGGLFLDPGLGKTGISLAAVKILLKEKLIDRALIVAPLRVCYSVWPKEADKWLDFNGLRIQILHGKDKEKNLDKDADIYLINPEGLPWLLNHSKFKKKFKGQALFVDESSKFKATNTKRFKLLRPTLPGFGRRYILTGSPAPNGLLDLFGQIYILDLGASLGRFVTHYRSKYFYPTGFGGYEWKLQPGADKLIHDQLRPLTLRMSAEDYLELPELIVNPIYVDLDEKAWGIYKEMEDELIAAIDRKEVVAVSAAVASGKCSQIANGGIYDADGKTHFIHNAKAEAVQDILEELNGTPALVAYEFGHDLARLQAVLGKDIPYIGGGVSPKRSTELEKAWNAGELPVLLGQPASIAHGLNLQNAGNHVIWHSLTWNFEHYDQFIKRIHRQGSLHNKVFVHQIIARNTIDELKLMALNRKFRTQQDLFEALSTFLRRPKDSVKYAFTTPTKYGIEESGQPTKPSTPKGETKMSKFAKKPKAEVETPVVETAPRAKIWTNNPEWQDQETGENTPAGEAQLKKVAAGKKSKEAVEAEGKKATKLKTVKTTEAKPAKVSAPKEGGARAEFALKKIKVLQKDHGAREGSQRATWYAALLSSKTVGDAQAKVEGLTTSVVNFAVKQGVISLS